MSDRCRVRYPRSKSTDASPRSQSPTPPRLWRYYSQRHLPPASSPSSADRAHSSLDSSLSPVNASRRAPGCLYRCHSPRSLGDRSDASPPCKSPRLAGKRCPAEGGDGVKEQVLSPSSPDPSLSSLSSTDCSPDYRMGREPQFVYDQLSERSLDVTTESAAPLLQEEMDVEEAAPNQGTATESLGGNFEAFCGCADNESLDAKMSSCVMDSVDTDNADAWVPSTEILLSPPIEMGSLKLFPNQLWCDEQSATQMSTTQPGSTTPQLVESMEMSGTTYYSVQPSYQFPLMTHPAPSLPRQPTVYPMVCALQIPTTQFQVIEPTHLYQIPGAQLSVPMMGVRGAVQTETRVLRPVPLRLVPLPGTSYPPIQSPYQTHPYSQSSFMPTNQPSNPTVFASPAASREVLPFMASSTYQFPHPLQTAAALEAAGVRWTMTQPLGSAYIVQTTSYFHLGFPDTLPIATPTYSTVNRTMLATPSSSSTSTAPASSVETSMISNLSDFRASAGVKDGSKEDSHTEVSRA